MEENGKDRLHFVTCFSAKIYKIMEIMVNRQQMRLQIVTKL